MIPLPDCDECRRLVGMRGGEREMEKNGLDISWMCWGRAGEREMCTSCHLFEARHMPNYSSPGGESNTKQEFGGCKECRGLLHDWGRPIDMNEALYEYCAVPGCICSELRRHVQHVHPEIWAFYLLTREAER